MPLTRSRENLANLDQPANVSFTVDLGSVNTLAGDQNNSNRVEENRSNNPATSVAQGTRSRGRNIAPVVNTNNAQSESVMHNNPQFRQIISESLHSFRGEMQDFISSEFRSIFHNINISNNASNSNNDNSSDNTTNSFNRHTNSSPRSSGSSQDPFYAEKVLNIIRNWRIKFSGHDNPIPVEEFIYRVNILTTKTLAGNFKILDDHAHCLFEGKALVWYWRYHRTHDNIDWLTLTNDLKNEYKVDYTDFDMLEDIRRRRQKPNETFDEYFEAISTLTDRLKFPLSDGDLCETMLRNLKYEIRHELLHLEIHSVSQLRKEVQRHEKFMKNLHALENRKSVRARVAEIIEHKDDLDDLSVTETKVCAVQHNPKCWNCEKVGHTYIECMETRKVFCYGCGARDTYKPTCANCNRNIQGNVQRDVRRK